MRTIKFILVLMAILVSAASFAGPIDINRADASTLAGAIAGVGESKAAAIVEYRDTHGPFASVNDLSNVKGVGMKIVDKSRHKLKVMVPSGK